MRQAGSPASQQPAGGKEETRLNKAVCNDLAKLLGFGGAL